ARVDGDEWARDGIVVGPSSRLSSIECRPTSEVCLVTNLYVLGGSLHAFIGGNFDLDGWEDFSIRSGIGYGASSFAFRLQNATVTTNATGAAAAGGTASDTNGDGNDNGNGNNDGGCGGPCIIPVLVHTSDPPGVDALPPATVYRPEPTAVFSVLWPNLFRTLYAGAAAWQTLAEFDLLIPDHFALLLADGAGTGAAQPSARPPQRRPDRFAPLLSKASPVPLSWLADVGDSVFRAAVLGLTQKARLAEMAVEDPVAAADPLAPRSRAVRGFAAHLKRQLLGERAVGGPTAQRLRGLLRRRQRGEEGSRDAAVIVDGRPHVVLVLREDGQLRRVLNGGALAAALHGLPGVRVTVVRFERLSLAEQAAVVDSADVLVAMHGAALAHTAFLRPGRFVVELFPFAFRKSVYQNLARVAGARYLSWQNQRTSRSTFHWEYVETHRATDAPRDRVTRLPIDWGNLDSKNYWRNQDTEVDVEAVRDLVATALRELTVPDSERYLMFMPWEQLNNQLIGLKSACAIAGMLNRTLVLPHIGHRKEVASTTGGDEAWAAWRDQQQEPPMEQSTFDVTQYVWRPMESYFDLELLRRHLPCAHITMDNFLSLNGGRSVGTLRFHSLGADVTNEQQLLDYYGSVVGVAHDGVVHDAAYMQLPRAALMRLHASEPQQQQQRVLPLGAMFWYYDFERPQEFPPRGYRSLLDHAAYRSAAAALAEPIERVARLADRAIDLPLLGGPEGDLVAVHARRGDYFAKCAALAVAAEAAGATREEALGRRARCATGPGYLLQRLREEGAVAAAAVSSSSTAATPALYVMTNAGADEAEFAGLGHALGRRVVFQ
ncbi:Protein O-linked-mannose beta-1,4-N-acetylglucosaminyltransferase 2, partial [Cladochytrium tenue]